MRARGRVNTEGLHTLHTPWNYAKFGRRQIGDCSAGKLKMPAKGDPLDPPRRIKATIRSA